MIMVIKIFASFSIISSVAVVIVVDDENQKYLSIELNNLLQVLLFFNNSYSKCSKIQFKLIDLRSELAQLRLLQGSYSNRIDHAPSIKRRSS